jgi:trans-aconitate methyltransferase
MQRTPEPELMDSPEQVQAYAAADFSESNQLFADAVLNAVNHHKANVLDLGCGPADIGLRLLSARPGWRMMGVDAGDNMLAAARTTFANRPEAERMDLVLARLPFDAVPGHESTAFDAILSNSLVHHLPDPMSLWHSLRMLAQPGTWIQVMDLMRPRSEDEAKRLLADHAGSASPVLQADFYNSLKAAWRVDEIQQQLADAGLSELSVTPVSNRHWMVCGQRIA